MKSNRLHIFISSRADLAVEQPVANKAVRRPSDEFEQPRRTEPVLSDYEPLLATSTSHKRIPRDCKLATGRGAA